VSKITSTVESVDADKAAMMLRSSTVNRPLSRATVDHYAAVMKRGEWLLNGEAVVFSERGRLLNGHHRLHAITKVGAPVPLLIVRGVADESFKTFDGGKKRSTSDVLGIRGEVNTRVLGAALRTFEFLTNGATARATFTPSRALQLLEQEPQIRYWSNQYVNHAKVKSIFTASLPGVLALASKRYGSEPLEVFLKQLESGAGLEAKSPALTLRERFQARKRGEVFAEELILAYYIKAVNAYVQKKPLAFLRQLPDEAFPRLV
jgi:hypothetical protein